MTDNPFTYAGKVPAEHFFPRVEETRRLTGSILNQENVVLVAPRMTGKTRLISRCFEDEGVRKDLYTVYADMSSTSSLREFVYVLVKAVYNQVAVTDSRLKGFFFSSLRSLRESFGNDPSVTGPHFDVKMGDVKSPQNTLDELFDFLEALDKRSIVAMGEFQRITFYPERNAEAVLRTVIQRCSNVNFIFSGTGALSDMFLDKKRPFYGSAVLLTMGPFDRTSYTRFVRKNFKAGGKSISDGAVKYVYDTFKGVPLYMQRIFHDAYSELKGSVCTEEFLRYLIGRYVSENNLRYGEILSRMGEGQKTLLYAICKDKVATKMTSSEFVSRHRLKSASSVQAAARKLLEYDFISKEGGKYTITDPLLQLWLESN